MTLTDSLRWVFRSLTSNRQRSALTTLGIAIGIMAVTMLTAIGEGLRVYLMDTFSQFGTRIVAVSPGRVTTQSMAGMLNSVRPLSVEDAESLRTLPQVEAVIPVVTGTARVESSNLARHTNLLGVNHEMPLAWKMEVATGQFLPDSGLQHPRALAVLGSKLATELFPQSALGEWVRVGERRFRVVGVMAPKGQLLGFDLDDVIYIPTPLALQMFNREGLMEIDIIFSPFTTSDAIAEGVRERLTRRHKQEDFTLFTQEDMLASLDRILNIITLAVAAMGAISLFVGGVGILTIMTTALQERRPEIGLLCAVGAVPRQILLLFLGEAIILAASGGIAGIAAIAAVVGVLQLTVPGLPLSLNLFYLLLALLLSVAIGLLAGIGPALHAARVDPIESLREE
ncbi:ABC transporter permease [Pseudomaricurvus sp. HS19]|uniref:ABC transporter permease n=1 Tax=Pseudomaricurvus sp. HS19 TaxID=2692626 RepID=UPI001369B186|nr:ABC transporter permease [Pseudomaricurvus sp. HS19]MYM62094.1 FtsX-like permease family protein [Pseudomaricurvus sp. HS19]